MMHSEVFTGSTTTKSFISPAPADSVTPLLLSVPFSSTPRSATVRTLIDAVRAEQAPRTDALAPPAEHIAGEAINGMSSGHFRPHFMPLVDLATGNWVGTEALSRWHHPTHGVLTPGKYLPFLDDEELMTTHDSVIAKAALEAIAPTVAEFRDRGQPFKVHLNLTAHSFYDVLLPLWLAQAARDADVPTDSITVELTENVYLDVTPAVRQTIRTLLTMGIKTVLDDFGKCYSGLSYLRENLFSGVKLDASFLEGLDGRLGTHRAKVVDGFLSLAKHVGVETVVEGVETTTQATMLAAMDCTVAQGYLFGEPVPISEFATQATRHCNARFANDDS